MIKQGLIACGADDGTHRGILLLNGSWPTTTAELNWIGVFVGLTTVGVGVVGSIHFWIGVGR